MLKALLLRNKIDSKKAELAELRTNAAELEKREKELESDINEAKTEEEKAVVEKAVNQFEQDKAENEKSISELRQPEDGKSVSMEDVQPVIDAAATAGNEQGCNAFPAGTFTGAIAFLQRGGCTFAIKEGNVRAAGAVAMLLFNSQGGPPSVAGGPRSTAP